MSSRSLRDVIAARGALRGLSFHDRELEQFEMYYSELARWNRRVNLTALSLDGAPLDTIDRLFIEPAIAAAEIPPAAAALIDIGSGGGSPAIPLKVLRPQLQLTMVESKQRKASFLREVARKLKLTETAVSGERFEDVASRLRARFISIRAVRLDDSLARAIETCLETDGTVLFFGAAAQERYPAVLALTRTLWLTEPDQALHLLTRRRPQ